MREPLRDRGVDGVFGDVAFHAGVVVPGAVARQRATLRLRLVRRLPGADDDFANASHGLAVG